VSDQAGSAAVDAHLATFDEPRRQTLEQLRADLLHLIPDATEGISYGMPCIKSAAKVMVGYDAFSRHCSLFPHSGSVLAQVTGMPTWCEAERGTLRFPIGRRLPTALLWRILAAKKAELEARAR
jgi:uncharacterized protein YdhG (YjbR/CyaY superfamily)